MGTVHGTTRKRKRKKRVTKTGGRIGPVCWDSAEHVHRAFWEAVITLDAQAQKCRPKKDSSYASADGLAAFWNDAGLREVAMTGLSIAREFDSLEDYWPPFLKAQGPAGGYLRTLSPEGQKAVRERLHHNLLGDRADGSFALSARAWAVRGTVP
jgi:hypothetical protein